MPLRTLTWLVLACLSWALAEPEPSSAQEVTITGPAVVPSPSAVANAAQVAAIPEPQASEEDPRKVHWVILPGAFSTAETGLGFALSGQANFLLKDGDPERRSFMQTAVAYTLRKQFVSSLSGDLFFNGRKHYLSGRWEGRLFTSPFYGLGNDVPDLHQNFTERAGRLNSDFLTSVTPELYVGGRHQGEYFGIRSTGARPERRDGVAYLDDPRTPGRDGSFVNGAGAIILYDTRDHNLYPYRGGYYMARWTIFPAFFGDYEATFSRLLVDLRQFYSPWLSHVIALQVWFEATSGTPPFNLTPKLGGPQQMRGFIMGRYSDEHYVTAQLEYRIPIYWRFSAVGFASVGGVFGANSSAFLGGLVVAGGIGIRFLISEKARSRVRLDAPIAQGEGFGVPIFQMNEAF